MFDTWRRPTSRPGLLLERPVERDGIFVDLPDRIAEVEQRQQPRRMPGRARRQFLALDENAVRPAFLGEMVERRDADHAPADDHRPRMRSHVVHRSRLDAEFVLDRRLGRAPSRSERAIANSIGHVRHRRLALVDELADRFVLRRDRAAAARIRRASISISALARMAASFEPSSRHCSTELLSAMLER